MVSTRATPPAEPQRDYVYVEERDGTVYVRERITTAKRPLAATVAPGAIVIVGGGGAGNAAAETLRRESYAGRLTMLSADESVPCDRPNLSKGFLAGSMPEESKPLRSVASIASRA